MTTFTTGRQAEAHAVEFLKEKGFEVLAQNWRTKRCEIDIVARRGQDIYFVEVKYRKTNLQGSGFDYVTANKLKQMHFAARLWVQQHDWRRDYHLSVIELSGLEYRVTGFIDDLQ